MFELVLNTPLHLSAMFKIDSKKNRLKHEIYWQKTHQKELVKIKNITVNKYKFRVHNSNDYFEFVSLYLVKIGFITLELNRYFRITITILEDNRKSKFIENTFRCK